MIGKLLNNTIKKLFGVDINAILDETYELRNQVNLLQEESDSFRNQLNVSNVKITSKEEEISSLRSELSNSQNEYSNLRREVSILRGQLTHSKNSNEALKGNISFLKSQLKELEDALSDLQQTNSELYAENEFIKNTNADLEAQNQGLTSQISLLETSIAELKKEAEDYRKKFEIEKSERENVQEELVNILKEKDAEMKALNDRITELSEAQQQESSKSEEMLFLERRNQALEEIVQNLQRDKELLQDEIGRKDGEIKKISEILNAERNVIENLKLDNDALNKSLKRLEEYITNIQKAQEKHGAEEEIEVANGSIPEVEPVEKPQDDIPAKPQCVEVQGHEIVSVPERKPNKKKEVEVLEEAGECIEDFPEIKNEGRSVKRSIEFVSNTEGEKVYADDFFVNSSAEEIARVSRKLSEADKTGTESWTCGMCHAKVKVAHRMYNGVESLFFIHACREHYCPWIKLSEKSVDTKTVVAEDIDEDEGITTGNYDDIRPTSRQLKEKIFSALTSSQSTAQGISNVRMDAIIRSSLPFMRWRRPDLSFDYKGKTVVIELQLRKTPLDTIVDKDIFYRLNNIHVIWVFGSDSDTTYQYLTQANYKNTMFANHRNVFVFDKEAQEESEQTQMLSLKCNWLDENNKWAIRSETEQRNGRIISLPELTFDDEFCKPYYFDANEPYFNLHPNAKAEYLKSIFSREELLKQLEEKWTRDDNYEEAIRQMKERDQNASIWQFGGLWGFRFNSTSMIQPIFTEEPKIISNGYFKVRLADSWGIVNRYGQKIVDWDGRFKCEDIDFDYNNHRVLIKNKGAWGIAEIKGGILVSCQFSAIENWAVETYRVKQNGKWGVVNLEGEIIVPCKYNRIDQLIGNKAKAELLASNNWQILHGTIDSLGRSISDEQINTPDGYVAVMVFERWGLEDFGNYLLEPEYEEISYWGKPSLYRVKKEGKWGVVNAASHETIVPTQYDEISELKDGVAILRLVGQLTNVDVNGNEVSQEEVFLQDGQRKIKKSGKWGIIDKAENEIVSCLYDEIGSFRGRMIGVINGRIVKLNAWYKYPIQLQTRFDKKTVKGLVFDIAGVKCFLPSQVLKLMNKTQQDIVDNQGFCHILVFSNIIIHDNKIIMRICEGDNLKKPLSHGDKDIDFQIGEALTGLVYEIRRFMKRTKKVLVKFEDGRKTMVPARFFKKFGKDINDYPINSTITLKKVGFDDDLDQTDWEIVR